MPKCTAAAVIAEAKKWVGYCEKKSKADLDSFAGNAGNKNYTRFNRDYVAATGDTSAQPEQWCGIFVSMMFTYAFGLTAAKNLLGALYKYTPSGAARFKKAGHYIQRGKGSPKPGDVVFFYSESKGRIAHTGIVYKVTSSRVYTIEGNTSGGSTLVTNGGCVAMKSYSLASTYLDGYGRPDYEAVEAGSDATFDLELGDRLLVNGCVGDDVRELQESLIALGYSCGSYGADGEFGSATEMAVKAFQRDKGLTVDGEYAEKSHAALTAAIAALDDAPAIESEPVGDLTVADGSWRVRTGPGTAYPTAGFAHGGDKLTSIDPGNWQSVEFNGEVRWISKKALEG